MYYHCQVLPSFSLSISPFPLPRPSLHDCGGQELVVVRKDQRLLIRQLSNSRFSAPPTLAIGHYRRAYPPLSSRSDRKSDLALFVATLLLLTFAALSLYRSRHVWMNDSDLLESNQRHNESISPSEDHSSTSIPNTNDNTRTRSLTNSDPIQKVTMLATQYPSAIGANIFSGNRQGKNPAAITMDLQTLRSSPILNPHFKMIQR